MQTNWNLIHIFQNKEEWIEEKEALKKKIKTHEIHLEKFGLSTLF